MAIYFMGGEPADFISLNNQSAMTTDGLRYRTDFARCGMMVSGSSTDFRNNAVASFSQPVTNFWFTARVDCEVNANLSSGFLTFLVFMDGTNKRLGFQINDQRQMRIVRFSDGVTSSIVATSADVVVQRSGLLKLDIKTVYGEAGSVEVYLDQTLAFSFSGDTRAGASTALDRFALGSFNSSTTATTTWSEIIAANRDTRTFMLRTHTPNSTTAAHTWAGTHADVAETSPNDATVISTDQPDAVAAFGLTDLPSNNLTVRAFKLRARVSRGENAPTKVALGLTTANTTTFGPDLPIGTGWSEVANTWEINPATNQTWTETQINALTIELKART